MKNVTALFYLYIEARRNLWNVYFKDKVSSIKKCSPLDEYEEITKLLFKGLVLRELGIADLDHNINFGITPIACFKVRIKPGIDRVSTMICEQTQDTGDKWSTSVLSIFPNTEFIFIDFFDWNLYDFVSYPYFLVEFNESKHSEHKGKKALIETIYCEIFYDNLSKSTDES